MLFSRSVHIDNLPTASITLNVVRNTADNGVAVLLQRHFQAQKSKSPKKECCNHKYCNRTTPVIDSLILHRNYYVRYCIYSMLRLPEMTQMTIATSVLLSVRIAPWRARWGSSGKESATVGDHSDCFKRRDATNCARSWEWIIRPSHYHSYFHTFALLLLYGDA